VPVVELQEPEAAVVPLFCRRPPLDFDRNGIGGGLDWALVSVSYFVSNKILVLTSHFCTYSHLPTNSTCHCLNFLGGREKGCSIYPHIPLCFLRSRI